MYKNVNILYFTIVNGTPEDARYAGAGMQRGDCYFVDGIIVASGSRHTPGKSREIESLTLIDLTSMADVDVVSNNTTDERSSAKGATRGIKTTCSLRPESRERVYTYRNLA